MKVKEISKNNNENSNSFRDTNLRYRLGGKVLVREKGVKGAMSYNGPFEVFDLTKNWVQVKKMCGTIVKY